MLLKSQGPLLVAKSLLRKHSTRHSSPDAAWTLASSENVLFPLCAVGGTPGGSERPSLAVLHVVAPDEGELDSYRLDGPFFFLIFFFFLLSAAQYLTFVCRQEIFKGYRWLWSKTPWKIHPTLPISCHKHTHSPQKLPHMAPSALHDGSWSTTVLTRETHVRTHRHTHTTGIHPCGGVVFFFYLYVK